MSLDKAIKSGAERRAPYFGSGRFDRTCRNHGKCPYCANNRKHPQKKIDLTLKELEAEVNEQTEKDAATELYHTD